MAERKRKSTVIDVTETKPQEVAVPQKKVEAFYRLKDSGEVNLENLSSEETHRYGAIARALDVHDMSTVISYGSDLQRAMDSYSSEFLSQHMKSSSSNECADLINNLLGQLREVDIDDLESPSKVKRILRKIPLLNKLVMSVEQIKSKYDTILEKTDKITAKLVAIRQIAIRDNNLLQKQFENNCDYVDQLSELIVAGKLKMQEVDATIEDMLSHTDNYHDYEISDMQEFRNSLERRLGDLVTLRYAFKQSLMQIRIIQRTNMMDATNTESQISMTMPLWKNQLSLAVALYNQKQSSKVNSLVSDTTNKLLTKNSEMMKQQAVEVVKQNQRSIIDIETLRKTTQDLVDTINNVQAAQREGAQRRAAAEVEIKRLDETMTRLSIGVQENTARITAKEFAQIESV